MRIMFKLGDISINFPVFLAPMSGVTDAPFRRQADRFGASAVVTEMVAGAELAGQRKDVIRRMACHGGKGPFIVQLIGRDIEFMKLGAKLAREAGADVIDINMGCPSRQVTGGQSGSALMRNLDHAENLIHATLEGAEHTPVTLKMRLGWDETSLNAAELAGRAASAGVQMVTVHGRTRQQFYKGQANWAAVANVVDAVDVPVIVNGDIVDCCTAAEALRQSGAAGVMVGRAAIGRPWLIGQVSSYLFEGRELVDPSLKDMQDSLCEQITDSVALYGTRIGVKTVRKHISAAVDYWPISAGETARRQLKATLCQIEDPATLIERIRELGRICVWEDAA